jgi:hypothetical protein
LIWFSVLVGLIAFLGLIKPRFFRFQDRQAPVWLGAVSIGLFVAGGMVLAPPGEIVVSSDLGLDELVLVDADREEVPRPEAESAARIVAERRETPTRDILWVFPMMEDLEARGISLGDMEGVNVGNWTTGPWPLTVEGALLVCTQIDGNDAAFVGADGQLWPLNGIASANRARLGAMPDLFPIWADNPVTGLKVNIGPMIARARELCR